MLDDYYHQYEQIILPRRYSPKLKPKNDELILSSRIFSNTTKDRKNKLHSQNKEDDPNSKVNQHILQKANMFLRQENIDLKGKILVLQNSIQLQKNTISKQNQEKESNNNYIVQLEKLVTHLKKQNSKLKKSKQEIIITTVKNTLNEPLTSIHNNASQDIIKRLEDDNKRLNEFKNEIFRIAKTYDEINHSIADLIIEIGRMFKEFKNDHFDNNFIPIQINSDIKRQFFARNKQTIDKILIEIITHITAKQDEFNLLLNEKESDMCLLLEQLKELKEHNANYLQQLNKRNKEIDEFKTQSLISKESNQQKRINRLIRSKSSSIM